MRNVLLACTLVLPLAGCGAAVDLAVVSGSVTILEPLINNNPNAKPWREDRRDVCYYRMSPYLTKADTCPYGVKNGTVIYKY